MDPTSAEPKGDVVMRTIAMPADTNAHGDIFGGWLMSQMDLGGAVLARDVAHSRVVTVAVEAMAFVAPVYVGDVVTCHARLLKTGRTSVTIAIDVWSKRYSDGSQCRVTHGIFTYVAIDSKGRPRPVRRRSK